MSKRSLASRCSASFSLMDGAGTSMCELLAIEHYILGCFQPSQFIVRGQLVQVIRACVSIIDPFAQAPGRR